MVNGSISDIFPLDWGTHQGYLLSSLLFALDFVINNNAPMTFFFIITDPQSCIPALTLIIRKLRQISGYKINDNKSEALPLGNFGDLSSWFNFPFRLATSCFTYLGIGVSANTKTFYKLNFIFTLTTVDLINWKDLPKSWMGRSLIKLPTILYPPQMLPLKLNRKAILDIDI